MRNVEVSSVLQVIQAEQDALEVYQRAVACGQKATETWEYDRSLGRCTTTEVMAAQTAAMELSLIADGVLHSLNRAPVGQRIGVLGRKRELER